MYFSMASAHESVGRFAEAVSLYTDAIGLDDKYSEAYKRRAICRSRMNNISGAVEDLRKAIKFNPSDANAYFNRGQLLSLMEKYSEAVEDYNRAIELDPSHAPYYNFRGNAQAYLKKYRSAIDDFAKAISIDENYEDAYMNYASACLEIGFLEGCLGALKKAAKLGNEAAAARLNDFRKYGLA